MAGTISKDTAAAAGTGLRQGRLYCTGAPANPECNYIAIDIKNEMLVLAKRKLELPMPNSSCRWTTSAL